MVQLKLTCPECGQPVRAGLDRRFQRCPECGHYSYLRPGQHDMFLRSLEDVMTSDDELRALARAEEDTLDKLQRLREDREKRLGRYREEMNRGLQTVRILVMNLVIVIITGLLLTSERSPQHEDAGVMAVLVGLGVITLLLLFLQTSSMRSSEFRLETLRGQVEAAEMELQQIRRRSDLRVTGSSAGSRQIGDDTPEVET